MQTTVRFTLTSVREYTPIQGAAGDSVAGLRRGRPTQGGVSHARVGDRGQERGGHRGDAGGRENCQVNSIVVTPIYSSGCYLSPPFYYCKRCSKLTPCGLSPKNRVQIIQKGVNPFPTERQY